MSCGAGVEGGGGGGGGGGGPTEFVARIVQPIGEQNSEGQ
jgi:hypothetical protein